MAKLNKLWTEEIRHLPKDVQESLLTEQPHTRFHGAAPKEFDFLLGPNVFVDLGFENYGLGKEKLFEYLRAFSGTGCLVPTASSPYWKLRNSRPLHSMIEPADGDEVALPPYWTECVLIVDSDDRIRWIGNRVRPDQLGDIDWAAFNQTTRFGGNGWEPK